MGARASQRWEVGEMTSSAGTRFISPDTRMIHRIETSNIYRRYYHDEAHQVVVLFKKQEKIFLFKREDEYKNKRSTSFLFDVLLFLSSRLGNSFFVMILIIIIITIRFSGHTLLFFLPALSISLPQLCVCVFVCVSLSTLSTRRRQYRNPLSSISIVPSRVTRRST